MKRLQLEIKSISKWMRKQFRVAMTFLKDIRQLIVLNLSRESVFHVQYGMNLYRSLKCFDEYIIIYDKTCQSNPLQYDLIWTLRFCWNCHGPDFTCHTMTLSTSYWENTIYIFFFHHIVSFIESSPTLVKSGMDIKWSFCQMHVLHKFSFIGSFTEQTLNCFWIY